MKIFILFSLLVPVSSYAFESGSSTRVYNGSARGYRNFIRQSYLTSATPMMASGYSSKGVDGEVFARASSAELTSPFFESSLSSSPMLTEPREEEDFRQESMEELEDLEEEEE